jgi:hypothetical protein
MLQKKKYCDGCKSEQYIWKNHEGNKYCKSCWLRKNTTPLSRKPDSLKQSAKNQLYAILRKKFFEDPQNHACKAHLPGCEVKACDVHHKRGRGEYLNDISTWIPLCRNCHIFCENNPEVAKELGFSEDRLGNM